MQFILKLAKKTIILEQLNYNRIDKLCFLAYNSGSSKNQLYF
jgi:hypothetical protein